MKTVAISGCTGMFGSMVYKVLKNKYKLVLLYRDKQKLTLLDNAYGEVNKHKTVQFDFQYLYNAYKRKSSTAHTTSALQKLIASVGNVDSLINCAGIIKPRVLESSEVTMFVNSLLPQILSTLYREKLIHITTDCVFDGVTGAPYDERSLKNAIDLYGLSKSIGEPSNHSLVLRTSFIGPEITHFTGLLEWLKRQEGKTVNGYITHLWNGLTTKQLAIILDRIVGKRNEFPAKGLFHIFSTAISKYELLVLCKKKFNMRVKITPSSPARLDRRLTTVHDLCQKLNVPSVEKMLFAL